MDQGRLKFGSTKLLIAVTKNLLFYILYGPETSQGDLSKGKRSQQSGSKGLGGRHRIREQLRSASLWFKRTVCVVFLEYQKAIDKGSEEASQAAKWLWALAPAERLGQLGEGCHIGPHVLSCSALLAMNGSKLGRVVHKFSWLALWRVQTFVFSVSVMSSDRPAMSSVWSATVSWETGATVILALFLKLPIKCP